jgi:hypothetical protein
MPKSLLILELKLWKLQEIIQKYFLFINAKEFVKLFKEANLIVIHKCTSIRHALSAQVSIFQLMNRKWVSMFFLLMDLNVLDILGKMMLGHLSCWPRQKKPCLFHSLPVVELLMDVDWLLLWHWEPMESIWELGIICISCHRFMCTVEAPVHPNIKQAIVEATELDTSLMFRTLHNTARVFKNKVSVEVVKIEKKPGGAKFEDVKDLVSGQRGRQVFINGDKDFGVWTAGQTIGLINDIPTCKVLVQRMVKEASTIINDLNYKL